MWLRTRCDLSFKVPEPTPFVLMLRPRSGAQQWIGAEEYKIEPSVPVQEFTDNYGNLCQRLVAPAGAFSIRTSAEVMTAEQMDRDPGAPFVPVQELPDEVLGYLLPSRYCESDCFGQMAADICTDRLPGYDQVQAITDWIRANIHYEYADSGTLASASQTNQQRTGVCRDFAHLGIAMCRSLCIPARMVVGYLYQLEPMDMHAWFEAYVGGQWYAFDATQPELRGGYVSIGYGRDAADVAVFNQFGPPVYPLRQEVQVDLLQRADAGD